MKTITNLLLLALTGITLNSFAQTNIVGGTVSGIWTKANSPYNIQGSILISNGDSLIIEPGVTVNFKGTYKLLVLGKLKAIGSSTDSITFTAANTTNGWRGIRFDNTASANDSSKIMYCSITYGNANGSGNDIYGGAFYFYKFSKAIISNCRISNCKANSSGGGIYCYNGSSPDISNNTISNNTSSGFGGGIYCQVSSPSISNNTISNNTSSSHGGGIYCEYSSPSISNNSISNNTASSSGGGIFCWYSSPSISNNSISNNTASSSGGGIYCYYSSPKFTNNSIVNNKATKGGALCCDYISNPTLRNTILYGNTATSGAQVYLDDENSDPGFYYCDVQGGTAAFGLNGNFYTGTYQNNINTIPLFVASTAGSGTGYNGLTADLSLQLGSACIDKGIVDTTGLNIPATDRAGNPRISAFRIDIGAYEYQPGLSPATITASGATTFCNGDSVKLTASSGTSYLWSNGATTSAITTKTAGNYSVTVTNSKGLSATSAATTVTVNSLPTATITASGATSFCNGDSVNLTASSGTSYLWSNNANTSSITAKTAGNYTVKVTDANGCSATSTATTVTVNTYVPTSTFTVTSPVCTNENSIITYTGSASSTATYTWNFNGGNIVSGTGQGPWQVNWTASGTKNITLTVTENTCTSTQTTIPVTVNALPVIPTITKNGAALTSSATSGNQWYLNGNIITSATTQSYTPTQNGTYTVTVTANGCSATSLAFNYTGVGIEEVAVNNKISISPNPTNGKFMVNMENGRWQMGDVKLAVYNVLGERVYSATHLQITKSSNHQIDLSALPAGIYFLQVNTGEELMNRKLVKE